MRSFIAGAILLLAWISISCSQPKKRHVHDAPLLPGMSDSASDSARRPEAPRSLSGAGDFDLYERTTDQGEMEEVDTELHPEKHRQKRQIPFEFNRRVEKWITYFSQKDRERFQRFFDRGEPYREVIVDILESNGVPADLYYLGMIESGFNAHAKSSAKAVGVWQFMRTTGRLYGLQSDHAIDERRDPIRATEAAAKMLLDLKRQFKSWHLALAAYNAGSGRIRSAIRRGRSHDFWTLIERKVLPAETMDYVPKFLAARYIGENPSLFGFFINEERRYPDVERVRVPGGIAFRSIEASCGMPEGLLAFVNPQYSGERTRPDRARESIWVPLKYSRQVRSRFEGSMGGNAQEPAESVVARKGDTLKTIASRHGLSVAYLKRVNGIEGAEVVPGQRIRIAAGSYLRTKAHPRKGSRGKAGE